MLYQIRQGLVLTLVECNEKGRLISPTDYQESNMMSRGLISLVLAETSWSSITL
jgi:hypothetical protein